MIRVIGVNIGVFVNDILESNEITLIEYKTF